MSKMLPNAAGVLGLLWDRLDKKAAPDEVLDFLSSAADEASGMARSLSDTVEGIACLISQDQGDDVGVSKCGSLQGTDLPILLFNISDSLKTIAELAFIGSEASFHLQERQAAKANGKSRRTRPAEDSSKGHA